VLILGAYRSTETTMRKIINSTYITLDGAVENPHLWPKLEKEDSRTHGKARISDIHFEVQNELLQSCDALLMGRRTYEGFAAAWPTRSGDSMSDRINSMRKYVASSTLRNPSWNNTTVIGNDLVAEVAALKQQPGRDIVQYGLGPVSLTLIEKGLVDEIRLWIHPIILGSEGPKSPHFLSWPPTRLPLVSIKKLPNGIAILTYVLKDSPEG
jgi:dihydrofolate reductase